MIDPHVHLRDWAQSEKETLAHGLSFAWRIGLSGVFEMPNTNPPLTTRDAIARRLADADRARAEINSPIFHGLYFGATPDPDQLAEVVAAHAEFFPRVVGMKLFAAHSTGRMGVITRDAQWRVWSRLAELDYRGVVAVHAETEDLCYPELWDPADPISHGTVRPVAAEIHSVRQQIELASEAGFRGSLHIVHVTTPDVLDIINEARGSHSFAIRGGVTPHHALLNDSLLRKSVVPEWKVNPPIRPPAIQEVMYQRVMSGSIDWIESDHAPHTLEDKRAGASGIPGIPAFRLLTDMLRERLSPDDADRLTHQAVIDAFQIPADTFPENPAAHAPWSYTDAATEYPWDPYRFLVG